MRGLAGVFGILSVLIAVAIGLYLYSNSAQTSLKTGQQIHKQIENLSGHDDLGQRADQSAVLVAGDRSIDVSSVNEGGPMAVFYGLQAGDKILKVGDVSVETFGGVAEMVFQEGYQKKNPLTVLRNGQKIVLPQPPGAASTLPPATPSAQPRQSALPTQAPVTRAPATPAPALPSAPQTPPPAPVTPPPGSQKPDPLGPLRGLPTHDQQ